jgi:hypothetical protein
LDAVTVEEQSPKALKDELFNVYILGLLLPKEGTSIFPKNYPHPQGQSVTSQRICILNFQVFSVPVLLL